MPPSKDQPPWAYYLDRFGFPVTTLVIILFAAWNFVGWFAPKADRMIETHVKTVDLIGSEVVTIRRSQAETEEKIDEIHNAVVKPKNLAGVR